MAQPAPDYAGAIDTLLEARRSDGGFAETVTGDYRPDATAWAVLCLEAWQVHPETVKAARARLIANQLPDGRIPLSPEYPDVIWPTAVAAMALDDVSTSHYAGVHHRAIAFLLATTGEHAPKDDDSPLGHDPSLAGWPWVVGTHSWVEPTALAIRALTLAGQSAHPRVQTGVRLLLDRQLPDGGWNYGNTTVYGKTLNPMPAASGVALWALAGLAEADQVAPSLDLLARQLPTLHTPLSLGWALLGLAAWQAEAAGAPARVADCLQRSQRYGAYGTSHLAILLTAAASLRLQGGRS